MNIRKLYRCNEVKIEETKDAFANRSYKIIFIKNAEVKYVLQVDRLTLIHLRTTLKKHKEWE